MVPASAVFAKAAGRVLPIESPAERRVPGEAAVGDSLRTTAPSGISGFEETSKSGVFL